MQTHGELTVAAKSEWFAVGLVFVALLGVLGLAGSLTSERGLLGPGGKAP